MVRQDNVISDNDKQTAPDEPERGQHYVHFKGGYYRVLHVASDTTAAARVVIYETANTGAVWSRPLLEWQEEVEWPDGVRRRRFMHRDGLPPELLPVLIRRLPDDSAIYHRYEVAVQPGEHLAHVPQKSIAATLWTATPDPNTKRMPTDDDVLNEICEHLGIFDPRNARIRPF